MGQRVRPNTRYMDYEMRAKEFTSNHKQSVAEGTEQFCEVCGGSLAESGKASRKLCKSTKPASELGASQLSSCISQGFRARATEKKFTINRKRQKVKGKKVKGGNYGGPLPVWKGNQ